MNNENLITVIYNGKSISAEKNTLLSDIIGAEKPCGGRALCGKCKVIAKGEISPITEREEELLSKEDISRGVRLSCLTYALGDCRVEPLYEEKDSLILADGELPDFELDPSFSKYGVAIDIGTTTVTAKLYRKDGKFLSSASRLNPQSAYGADVISRIEASLGGKRAELARSIASAIDSMLAELCESASIPCEEIDGVVITGNTVMLSLLSEISVEPFSHAPFLAEELFGKTVSAESLSIKALKNDTPIYLPRCISAFVGADTSCAVLASEMTKREEKSLLVDIGTNGEIALFDKDNLLVASTAAGPAFEGVNISSGMRASFGAIDKADLYNGQIIPHVIGDCEPIGICGSGLIDCVCCMLGLGELDESGYLECEKFFISEKVYISDKDIRMLQLAKSAISSGMLTLIDEGKIAQKEIATLYIAGGFGNYLNLRNAESIGLLPMGFASVAKVIGNAALEGAVMLLLNTSFRKELEKISKSAKTVELSSNKKFSDYYIDRMLF